MGVFSNMLYTFDFARMGRVKDTRTNGLHTFGFTFYFLTILVNGAVGIYLVTRCRSRKSAKQDSSRASSN